MIRQHDRVNYSPIRGQEPTIRNAEIYYLDIPNAVAHLTGWPHRTFPLSHLTKAKPGVI